MRFNKYQTLVQAKKSLRNKGFIFSFKLKKNKMKCTQTDDLYTSDNMRIVEYHRFNGLSSSPNQSILLAVICNDGKKGLITSTFGPNMDMALVTFLDKVKILREESTLFF